MQSTNVVSNGGLIAAVTAAGGRVSDVWASEQRSCLGLLQRVRQKKGKFSSFFTFKPTVDFCLRG
jgi:hypothetical protein